MIVVERIRAAFRALVLTIPQVLASPNVHRAGIYVASALTSALIPFLLLPILARALGPSGYGMVGAFTGLVSIASVLVGASTHGMLTTTFFRVDEAQFRRYLAACVWIAAFTAPALWLAATLAGSWLERATGVPEAWYWALIGAAAGQFLLAVSLAVCQVRGQARRFAALQITNSALNLLLTIGVVVGLSWGWEGRAVAQCVATLGVGIVGLMLINGRAGLSISTDSKSVRKALTFGVPLMPHSLAAAVMASADRLILISVVGAATAGQYFAAFQVAGVISLTSSAVNQAMVPWLFRSLAEGAEGTSRRIVQVSYLILLALILQGSVIIILAHPLIRIAGGVEFASAASLVRILAIAMTMNGAYYLFANYIFYAHKTQWLSVVTVSVSVFQVLVTLTMAHFYGATGAAWASVATNAVYLAGVWTLASRLIPMPWFSFWNVAR